MAEGTIWASIEANASLAGEVLRIAKTLRDRLIVAEALDKVTSTPARVGLFQPLDVTFDDLSASLDVLTDLVTTLGESAKGESRSTASATVAVKRGW